MHRALDARGVAVVAEVAQHLHRCEEDACGVGCVLPSDVQAGVAASLENGLAAATHVDAAEHAWTANQPRCHVDHQCAVEVGQQEHIKLMGVHRHLHACIVDDHFLESDFGIFLGHIPAGFQEAAVRQFHDVGLVDAGHRLAALRLRDVECRVGDAGGRLARDDLDGLHNTGNHHFLYARVLALRVFPHKDHVQPIVARFHARQTAHVANIRIKLQGGSQHVRPRLRALADLRDPGAFECNLVAGERRQQIGIHAVFPERLPTDGHFRCLESAHNGGSDLWPNAVARDEGDGACLGRCLSSGL
mmetsp:Transcript_27940/g.70104  ORF Transcript_27940/g.70104 Transcript_27940/m.70104 type:complete len:303 (-) Transcript_27940:98-1006(-)